MGDANGKRQAERERSFFAMVWERKLGLGVLFAAVLWFWRRPRPDPGEPRPIKELLNRRTLRREAAR